VPEGEPRPAWLRDWIAVAVALTIGIWLATVDARPGFDDTGMLVSLLFVSPAVLAGATGRWPWLWALLVGAPIPLVEVFSTGSPTALVAIAIAGLGAAFGWAIGRAARAQGSR
jgi:hypothetical protein